MTQAWQRAVIGVYRAPCCVPTNELRRVLSIDRSQNRRELSTGFNVYVWSILYLVILLTMSSTRSLKIHNI